MPGFLAKQGNHLTLDDVFMAAKLANLKTEAIKLEVAKTKRIAAAKAHSEGMAVKALGKPVEQIIVKDLEMILDMHQVSKKSRGKQDKKRAKVSELWSKDTPAFDPWTAAGEEDLKKKKEFKIDMKDTALGRYQAQEKLRVRATMDSMDNGERAELLEHMELKDKAKGPSCTRPR